MNLLRSLLLGFACVMLGAAGPWTPEDYARTDWPLEGRLDGGGERLVFVLAHPVPEGTQEQLWGVSLARGMARRLFPSLAHARAPRFSPSGRLAFLGSAKGEVLQACLETPEGPRFLTHRPGGVKDLAWRDEGHLVLAAEEAPTAPQGGDDAIVVDDDAHLVPLGLWELEVGTGKVRRITRTRDRIAHFQVSPDGRYAVALHERGTRWEYDQKVPPATRVWDLATGACQEVATGPQVVPDIFAWSKDSRTFYGVHRRSRHPYLSQAGVQAAVAAALPDWQPRPLALAWERGFGPSFQPLAERILVNLEDGLYRRAAFLPAAGGAPRVLAGPAEGTPEQVLADPAGRRGAALLSRADRPPQWYQVAYEEDRMTVLRPLTRLNPHLEGKTPARVEPYHLGPLEGLLYYPAGYQAGRPCPLVLNPHGGPALNDRDEWNENEHHPAQLHAQAGAFVLKLNYSGSTGYGQAFAESSMGRYLELELPELKAALADLVARGLVDPGRIGVTGWSNGAILASALAVDCPYPLKALSLGAGDVNATSDWGNCQFGEAFDAYYLGRSLVDDPELYWRKSTLPALGRIRAATIIFHGDKDREVPTEQSWQAFRFLQQAGKVPVRFVLFPEEGHEFTRPAHIRRKLQEEMAWFDTYLYGKQP